MAFVYDGFSLQNKRRTNMDSLLVTSRIISGQSVYLAVVCDGVGSLEDGAFAAAEAIRLLHRWFHDLSDTRRIGFGLREVVKKLDSCILEEAKAMRIKTASTLSALLIEDEDTQGRYYIVHTGDSRIYGYSHQTLTQLTADHSFHGKLTSYIGRQGGASIDYAEGNSCGMTFLLCSDGLYKRMQEEVLLSGLAMAGTWSIRKTMRYLSDYVIRNGERDNISLALLIPEETG